MRCSKEFWQIMRNLVPQFILDQFVRGHFAGGFQAATLFMDISGFTATTNIFMQQSRAGGEAMADVMQSIFDPLVAAVYGYGGFITGFAGDAFTAVFPEVTAVNRSDFTFIPQALSGKPPDVRALAAALTMQRLMQEEPESETPWGTFTFAIKIGLAWGEVAWRIIGGQEPGAERHAGQIGHAYYFRGQAIDECGASEQAAGRNELVVSDGFFQRLANQLDVVPVQKGFWRITAVRAALPVLESTYLIPPDPNLLAIFVPRAILQQQVRGEYRHVFTLFLQLQNVQNDAQLDQFVRHIFDLQTQYGGYLNTIHFGDKGCNLLLFWGMPTSFENDVERVLNFVLRLRQETAVFFRAGISHRLMYAGFVGSTAHRQEYSCYGRGVNLASRLMSAAPWGDIWVDENVARRALPHFVLARQGRFRFKGFAEPQPVYLLHDWRATTHPLYQGRMVARQRDLASLARWIKPVADGRFPGIAHIFGEAGIGKSRLVTEFRRQILRTNPGFADTWQWFTCQTDEVLRHSLNPFRHLLRVYFQCKINHSTAQNLENFNLIFADLMDSMTNDQQRDEMGQLRAHLQALLELPISDAEYDRSSADGRFNNTLLALTLLLLAESQRQPVVLHIEDVHWLDADSWKLLGQIAYAAANYPIAILLTGRTGPTFSDLLPLLPPNSVTLTIGLNALNPSALAELAASVIGHAPSPELVRLLVERSDGNPFFAEQILLYLAEQELLTEVNKGESEVKILPMDVRTVLIARLDRLSQEVREVVQQASILGREFDVLLLAHMLRHDQNLHTHILVAEQAAIWTAINQLQYLFKHALLRDAAYDMQLQARRQALHKTAAEALETVYARELPSHYAQLVYHYGQADLWAKEQHYALLAGVQAATQYANEEAEHYLTRALSLTEDAETRTDLLLYLEDVHNLQGKRQHQEGELAELFKLVQRLDYAEKTAVVLSRQARYANFTSQYALAAEAAAHCIALAEKEETAAMGHLQWARALWRQGQYAAAREQIAQAQEAYRALGDQEGLAHALNEAGIIAQYLSQHAESHACYQEALAIFQATGNRLSMAKILTNSGNLEHGAGRYSQAIDLYRQAIAIWEQHGQRQQLAVAFLNMGVALRDMGDFAAAGTYLARALPMSQEIREKTMEGAVLVNLTLLHHQLGEQETAVAYGRLAVPMLESVSAPHFAASAHIWLAHALAALGQHEEAVQHYQQAISWRRETGQEAMLLEPQAGLARVALAQHDLAALQKYGEIIWQAVQQDPDLPDVHERVRVYLTGFYCLRAVGDGRADLLLTQGYTLLRRLAAYLADESQRRLFLRRIPAHREIRAVWQARKPV